MAVISFGGLGCCLNLVDCALYAVHSVLQVNCCRQVICVVDVQALKLANKSVLISLSPET